MGVLTKEAILGAADSQIQQVQVPEWGGVVCVRGLRGSERDAFEAGVYTGRGLNMANVRARLCALGICDESGNSLFTAADVAALGGKSGSAIARCYEAIRSLSGMTAADQEEIEKNLEPTPGEGSS